MKTVYLALGSNLGNREHNLDEAVRLLSAARIEIVKRSSIFETAPVGLADQPWFLNQAIEAKTSLFPRQLLHAAQAIERQLGRQRTLPNGPRTIDIDILLYGRTVMNSDELTIPHPRMAGRRFVLEPLAEIAPGLRHPVSKTRIADLLDQIKSQNVKPFRTPRAPGL